MTTLVLGATGKTGRDAKVTCKAKGTKQVHVTCSVKLSARHAKLTRRGATYAAGTAGTLHAVRPLARGEHYTLRVGSRSFPVVVK